MLALNEEDLKRAIVQQAADQLIDDEGLSAMVRKEVEKRVSAIFLNRAEAEIEAAVNEAVRSGFDRVYQRVNCYGEPSGNPTTIKRELEKIADGYWLAKVDPKTGKPATSDYNSISRAEYLMTQICGESFSEAMKQNALNVTGALKDGLRNQMGKQMDAILNELFKVKSLQDQGKVEKPY